MCRTAKSNGRYYCLSYFRTWRAYIELHCGHKVQSYNSCRNRNCPKCQYIKRMQWVDKLAADLPGNIFIVFTIPVSAQTVLYQSEDCLFLLFKAAGQTLMQCARNTHYLGAEAELLPCYTWGQTMTITRIFIPLFLRRYPMMEWNGYQVLKVFVPVKVLSTVFRGILCRLLQSVFRKEIKLPDDTPDFQTIKQNATLKNGWFMQKTVCFTR